VTSRALAVALVFVVALGRAHAEEDTQGYRVKKGDTLELVAAEFYGDHQHTMIFLMVANKIQHPRPLVPGEKLKVPTNREVTTVKGDKFSSLAKTYLGDADRASFLAEFNRMGVDDSLATGTTILVPFRVTHTAAGPETLPQISLAYFGDAKEAEMLRTYNNLGDKQQLEKNETLIVPNFHVRVRAEKLPAIDAEANARRAEQKQAAAKAQTALLRARTSWLRGDFADVRSALVGVAKELDYLDAETATAVGVLLGKAYVAFDDTTSAVAIFAEVLARSSYQMSAYAESPKVIAAWKQASGHVQGEK
jgi:LysM repeat protein